MINMIPEQESISRRERILQAALVIFTCNGFGPTRMSDISNVADTSYGLTYHYFKSKDEIYSELIQHAIKSSTMIMENVNHLRCKSLDKIQKLTDRIFKSLAKKETAGHYFVLMLHTLISNDHPACIDSFLEECMKPFDILRDIISDGQLHNEIREGSPADMSTVYFSAILGLSALLVSNRLDFLPDSSNLVRIFL